MRGRGGALNLTPDTSHGHMTQSSGEAGVITQVAPNPLKRAALISTALVLVGASITLLLAATQWYAMWSPVKIMGLASVPITLVATFASTPQDRTRVKEMIGPALVSLLVSLILGTLGGFAWREDGARMQALELARARGQHEILGQALLSTDRLIADRACAQLLSTRAPAPRLRALEVLEEHPRRAAACLAQLDEARQAEYSALLVDRWWRRLELADDREHACALGEGVADVSASAPASADALLSCALTLEQPATRGCCVEALTGAELVGAALARRARRADAPAYEAPMATRLMAAAFHQKGLKDAEKEAAGELKLASSPMRSYALEIACAHLSLDAPDGGLSYAEQFFAATDEACSLRASSVRDDPGFWAGVCQTLAREADAERPLAAQMCDLTRVEMERQAVLAARSTIHIASHTDSDRAYTPIDEMVRTIDAAAMRSGMIDPGDPLERQRNQGAFMAADAPRLRSLTEMGDRAFRQQEAKKNQLLSDAQLKDLNARGEAAEQALGGVSTEERIRLMNATQKKFKR